MRVSRTSVQSDIIKLCTEFSEVKRFGVSRLHEKESIATIMYAYS